MRIVRGRPACDGAGVSLTRVIGGPDLPDLDPFLMLDEFRSDDAADYLAGFPDHPHRGFETVTYMLAGRMRHGDNKGNSGLLLPGGAQWMTAGRGIVHSEMPEQEDGLMWGFQLWVNLPARDKMTRAALSGHRAGKYSRSRSAGRRRASRVVAGARRRHDRPGDGGRDRSGLSRPDACPRVPQPKSRSRPATPPSPMSMTAPRASGPTAARGTSAAASLPC